MKKNSRRAVGTLMYSVAKEGFHEQHRLFHRYRQQAINALQTGRNCHFQPETIYSSRTDFERVEAYRSKFIRDVLLPFALSCRKIATETKFYG